jgi:hypothetical protein
MPLVRTKRATSAPVVRAPLTKYVKTKGKGAKIYKDLAGAKSSGGLLNDTIITIFGNTSGDKYPRIHSVKGKLLTNKSWYIENKNLSNHLSMSDDPEPKPEPEPKSVSKPVVSRRIRSQIPPRSKAPRRRTTRGPRDVALRKAWEKVEATPAGVLYPIEEVGDDKEAAGMNKKKKTRKDKQKKRKSKKRN